MQPVGGQELTIAGGLLTPSSRIGFAPFSNGVCATAGMVATMVLNSSSILLEPPLQAVTRYLVCYSVDGGATWQVQLLFFSAVCTHAGRAIALACRCAGTCAKDGPGHAECCGTCTGAASNRSASGHADNSHVASVWTGVRRVQLHHGGSNSSGVHRHRGSFHPGSFTLGQPTHGHRNAHGQRLRTGCARNGADARLRVTGRTLPWPRSDRHATSQPTRTCW